MIFLLLNIICSTIIVVVFKLIGNLKINTNNTIVFNYITACILGLLLNKSTSNWTFSFGEPWVYIALVIGSFFVLLFHLIAFTSQKVGIGTASISAKMSMVIPIIFSVLWYKEETSFVKYAGIILALVSVFLIVFRNSEKKIDRRFIILPIILFVGTGLVDILMKYSQQEYISDEKLPMFSSVLFGVAAIIGVGYNFVVSKNFGGYLSLRSIFAGLILGCANFGSVYFFILALSHSKLDSSVVFGLNNTGVVGLSVLIGVLAFSEKLSKLNWVGVALAVIAIAMLSTLTKVLTLFINLSC